MASEDDAHMHLSTGVMKLSEKNPLLITSTVPLKKKKKGRKKKVLGHKMYE